MATDSRLISAAVTWMLGPAVYLWMTVSLDGFNETRDGKIHRTAPDAELPRFLNERARKLGVFLHGPHMYEGIGEPAPTLHTP